MENKAKNGAHEYLNDNGGRGSEHENALTAAKSRVHAIGFMGAAGVGVTIVGVYMRRRTKNENLYDYEEFLDFDEL